MPLLGQAALAMWWEVDPALRAEFEDWHVHEHFPERLSLPGFLRGSRWVSATGTGDVFIIYELERYETLTSPEYRARLNDPTPWSRKMMSHHTGMIRSQCRVLESFGAGLPGAVLTVRFSPGSAGNDAVRARIRDLVHDLPMRPGLTGAHLLITDTPDAPPTAEQKIRGRDATADWIVILGGYDLETIRAVAADRFTASALGITAEPRHDLFRLCFSMSKSDL